MTIPPTPANTRPSSRRMRRSDSSIRPARTGTGIRCRAASSAAEAISPGRWAAFSSDIDLVNGSVVVSSLTSLESGRVSPFTEDRGFSWFQVGGIHSSSARNQRRSARARRCRELCPSTLIAGMFELESPLGHVVGRRPPGNATRQCTRQCTRQRNRQRNQQRTQQCGRLRHQRSRGSGPDHDGKAGRSARHPTDRPGRSTVCRGGHRSRWGRSRTSVRPAGRGRLGAAGSAVPRSRRRSRTRDVFRQLIPRISDQQGLPAGGRSCAVADPHSGRAPR